MIRLNFTRSMHGFPVGASQTDPNNARDYHFALHGLLLPGVSCSANRPRTRKWCDGYTHQRTTLDHQFQHPRCAQPFTHCILHHHPFANRNGHLDTQHDLYPIYTAYPHPNRHRNRNTHTDGDLNHHPERYPGAAYAYSYTYTFTYVYACSYNRSKY